MTESEALLSILAGALAGGAISLLTLVYNSAQDRRDRHREHFSKALESVVQYEEFPYIVRRRRASDREGERIRISTEMRKVQAHLSYHCAWLMTESRDVGKAYQTLVRELRRTAGGLVHEAWTLPPIAEDEGMNIPDIGPEIAKLEPFKERYLSEVTDHLSLWRRWFRRLRR